MQQFIRTIDALDRRIILTLHLRQAKRIRPRATRMIGWLTHLGGIPLQISLILILFVIPQTRPMGIKLLIAQLFVTMLVQLVKHGIARTRPYEAIAGITPRQVERDSSFPSGHTASAFTAAMIIGCFYPAIQFFLLIVAGFIGYSRIHIGVHYLTDVIAGSGIGIVVSALILLVHGL